MKKQILTTWLIVGILSFNFSCVNGDGLKNDDKTNTEKNDDLALKEHEEFLEKRRDELTLLIDKIQGLGNLIEGDTLISFDENESIQFGFSPVIGTLTEDPKIVSEFNAVLLSTEELGKELTENMPEHMFKSDFLSIIEGLLEGKKYFSGIPNRDDNRFPDVANAHIEAAQQLRYVLLVDVTAYKKGSVVAVANIVYPPYMEGVILLYDLKEEHILEKRPFSIEGFETLNFQYKDSDSFDEQQRIAENAFEKKCERYFQDKIKEMYEIQ